MSHVSIKSGSEGPRHDPYHYNEMTVERPNGDTIVIHEGLANWCRVTRRDSNVIFVTEGEQAPRKMFHNYVGTTLEKVIKGYKSLPYRRIKAHPCRPRDFVQMEGYPGETFLVCRHCKNPVDYHFDLSAVE